MRSFKDVVGHKDIIHYMQTAAAEQKVSHAYIFHGEKGSGKKLLAGLFATALLCEKRGKDPCGACHSCVQAESGNHPDILWVSHEKPGSIGVDDVRSQMNSTVQIKPYQGPYKIYIIDQSDLLTEQAQNALLKTIEEPPEYAVIILLAENADTLLPTITSRCVMLKLRNIKDAIIKKHLMERRGVPDYKADVCAAFARGNLGKAIMLVDSEHFNEVLEDVLRLMHHVREMDMAEITGTVKKASDYKLEIDDYLDLIMIWYRDVLLYKATKDVNKIIFKEEIDKMKEQVRESSYEGIEKVIESLDTAKARLKANVNFELVMELLFLTMKEN